MFVIKIVLTHRHLARDYTYAQTHKHTHTMIMKVIYKGREVDLIAPESNTLFLISYIQYLCTFYSSWVNNML